MGSKKTSPAVPASAADGNVKHDIRSDTAVVISCLVDGENMDAPDVAECRQRLALHREGRDVPGYPARVEPAEYVERPRRIKS